jgi:hypothetical protein
LAYFFSLTVLLRPAWVFIEWFLGLTKEKLRYLKSWHIHSLIFYEFTCLSINLFIRYIFIHLFVYSFLFIYLFSYLFIYSFIYLFIYLFIIMQSFYHKTFYRAHSKLFWLPILFVWLAESLPLLLIWARFLCLYLFPFVPSFYV